MHDKSREQLLQELAELRQRIIELEAIEAEHKQVEPKFNEVIAKIERAKQEWETTVDSLSELICLLDDQGYIIRANRTIERWQLGQVTTIKGRSVQELFDPTWQSFWLEARDQLLRGQPAECETKDESLNRYLHIQLQPLSTQTNRKIRATSFAVLIVQDITERKQAEEALRQSNIQLQARNEELDAFAHTVAHDLKNSLGTITVYSSMLADYYAIIPDEERKDYLQSILQTGQKMINITDELLLLAGVRKQEISPEPLDMAAIVAEAQQRLRHMIEEYQAEIRPSTEWPPALGYAPWVEEVWVNYISNGLKYGGDPPRLELGATKLDDGTIRFWVGDNGPGLTPDAQARLFTPFTRLDQMRVTGNGLGLSIVRRIVEKLGGQVSVESEPGQGSFFAFTLPGAPK